MHLEIFGKLMVCLDRAGLSGGTLEGVECASRARLARDDSGD